MQIEPQFGFTLKDVAQIAEKALAYNFGTLWFSDHFMLDENATDRILLDPWLLMTHLVNMNSNIRVGTLVLCNSYRMPALHAKMGATLDWLSKGRFEFGIGAGWKELEYNAYGYEFPDDFTRIEQLAEAIQIIKGIWSNEKFSFKGTHYQVEQVVSSPKPIQKPHPTVWVGTMKGKVRMVDVAARYGDGINLAWAFSPEECGIIFDEVDSRAESYTRENEIKKSVGFWTRCFEDEKTLDSAISEAAKKRGISEEKYRERISTALWGTPEQIKEKLVHYKKLGVSHFIFMFPHENEIEQIEIFGQEILPKL